MVGIILFINYALAIVIAFNGMINLNIMSLAIAGLQMIIGNYIYLVYEEYLEEPNKMENV